MTSHSAIRDSIVEISRRVFKHNNDVQEMKNFMEYVERSQPGDSFTSVVRTILQPVSQYIATKNIDEISKVYKDFPLKTIIENVPESEQNAMWQALSMTNMLLTTLQMVPPDMLTKIEAMTNSMMGAMQQGGGLNDLFKNIGSTMNDDSDSSEEEIKRKPRKKGVSKQAEFRNKLC